MDKDIKPIFIFSLPRSGSTLLQKLLMTHSKINSIAEPWLLLPFISTVKEDEILAKYSHQICYNAFQDFISNIGGKEVYLNALKEFALKLYSSTSNEEHMYFLDKTPRYYRIIPEIVEIFPEAKFIFLFRNPLAIYSSMLKTWSENKYLGFHKHYTDLFIGPECLVKGYKILEISSIKLNYEDLVIDKETELLKIADYLELDFDKFNLEQFKSQDLKGKMGDQNGIKKYSGINKSSLDKWKTTFNTLYRKKLVKKYINYLSDEYLELTGVGRNNIINKINEIKTKSLGIKDFLDLLISNIYQKIKGKFQVQHGWELLNKNEEDSLYF